MKKNANKEIEVSLSDYIGDMIISTIPSKKRLKRSYKRLKNNRATYKDIMTLEIYSCFCKVSERSRRK